MTCLLQLRMDPVRRLILFSFSPDLFFYAGADTIIGMCNYNHAFILVFFVIIYI